jgi:hypothetical protein
MPKPKAVITIVQEYERAGSGALAVRVHFSPEVTDATDEKDIPMSHIAAMVAIEAINKQIGDGSPPVITTGSTHMEI